MKWVEAHPNLDSTKMWIWGFSRNSLFTVYAAYCFPKNFVGLFQAGSTMMQKGLKPFGRGCKPQVTGESWKVCKEEGKRGLSCEECAAKYPCEDCKYFPTYPCYNPERPMIDCSANYIDDGLIYEVEDKKPSNASNPGNAWRMYEALERYSFNKSFAYNCNLVFVFHGHCFQPWILIVFFSYLRSASMASEVKRGHT